MTEQTENKGVDLARSLQEMFSFTKTSNESINENLKAFSSTAHLLSQMIVKTETRIAEGTEAIKYLDLAFTYYRMGQERKLLKEEKQEEKS